MSESGIDTECLSMLWMRVSGLRTARSSMVGKADG